MLWGRLITARATANQLLLLRLVFHPIIWGVMSLMFQHTARWIGELSPTASVTRDALPCTIPTCHVTNHQTACCSATRSRLTQQQMQCCTEQQAEAGPGLSSTSGTAKAQITSCLTICNQPAQAHQSRGGWTSCLAESAIAGVCVLAHNLPGTNI